MPPNVPASPIRIMLSSKMGTDFHEQTAEILRQFGDDLRCVSRMKEARLLMKDVHDKIAKAATESPCKDGDLVLEQLSIIFEGVILMIRHRVQAVGTSFFDENDSLQDLH